MLTNKHRLRSALRHPVEFWSAIGAIAWCKYLYYLNGTLLGNSSYSVATRLFSTAEWEMIALTVGCLQLTTLWIGGRWVRSIGAAAASWFWITLGYSFFLSHSGSPGFVPVLAWGFVNLHATVQAFCAPPRP